MPSWRAGLGQLASFRVGVRSRPDRTCLDESFVAVDVNRRWLLCAETCVVVGGSGSGGVVRLLFIGGTSFVGRHAVERAVGEGHSVTVFHRGRTNPGLLADRIEHRLGDRDTGDYASIDGAESWDAVIDVCAYVPRHVHQLADVLAARCGHYVHVSSVSAYDPARATVYEDSPLHDDLLGRSRGWRTRNTRRATARHGDLDRRRSDTDSTNRKVPVGSRAARRGAW